MERSTHTTRPSRVTYLFSNRVVAAPARRRARARRLFSTSSGCVTTAQPVPRGSSSGRPSIWRNARLVLRNRSSGLVSDIPTGASSKAVRNRSSLSRSAVSARLRSVRSRMKATDSSRFSPTRAYPTRTGTRVPSRRRYSFSYGVQTPFSRASAIRSASTGSHSGG